MRFLFRSRWAALAWCVAICWMAISFAGGDSSQTSNDTASNVDSDAAQISALLGK